MPKFPVVLIGEDHPLKDGFAILRVEEGAETVFATDRLYTTREEAQKKADELTKETAEKAKDKKSK